MNPASENAPVHELYDFLPGLFKLLEQTWGIALVDLVMLPQLFLVGAGVIIVVTSCFRLPTSESAARKLRIGVVVGGGLLAAGHAMALLQSVLGNSQGGVDAIAHLAVFVGLLMVGTAIVTMTHKVYDTAC